MVTKEGPKLVEYNARFGDPECQVLMLRMMSDIVPALIACADGQLKNFSLRWFDDVALTVVMATEGLSRRLSARARVIEGLDDAAQSKASRSFMPAPSSKDGKILANGGRVLNVCATGKTVTRSAAARLSGGRPHQMAGRLLPPRHRLAGGGAGEADDERLMVVAVIARSASDEAIQSCCISGLLRFARNDELKSNRRPPHLPWCRARGMP